METPIDLRYTEDHEWARREGEAIRVGITDFAQQALGDVVFIDLPKAGLEIEKDGVLGEVESTKSVSELYAPVAGVVVEVNAELAAAPERLNTDPYGAGWICVLKPKDFAGLEELLDADAYTQLTADAPS